MKQGLGNRREMILPGHLSGPYWRGGRPISKENCPAPLLLMDQEGGVPLSCNVLAYWVQCKRVYVRSSGA